MTVLNKKNNWKAPFFGKSNDYTTGRDPLGLQTTSQASYSTLLSGLTNLTDRIRYYGFYCWLLELYAKKIGNTDYKEQYKFIRRAELIIALLMKSKSPQTTQIPGSSYAENEIQNNKLDYYDISQGADIEKGKNTYWKYSSGAFGQYYSGALKTIGIILTRDDEKSYICSRKKEDIKISGQEISEAFNENIEENALNLFFESVQNGKLYKKNIEFLFNNFSIINIKDNSKEKELYINLLLDKDKPLEQKYDNETYFRKDTIILTLKHLNENEEENFDLRYIFEHIYHTKGFDYTNQKSDASFGWYYYQFNEYWHFAVETIFWAMLYTLEFKTEIYLQQFIDEFTTTITNSLIENKLILSTEQKLSHILQEIDNTDETELSVSKNILETIKEKDIDQTVYLGIKLLLLITKNNKTELEELEHFAVKNKINNGNGGDCISNIKSFDNFENKPIIDFLHSFLIKNVINRHIYVAHKKMGTGVKNTLKFSYEDNTLKWVETLKPVWTTPRIFALYHFFEDLKLVDKKGKITSESENLLSLWN